MISQFLKLPGYWIDGENRDAASNTYLFLEFAIGAFNEEAVAQRAFESCYSRFVRDKSAARSQRVARVDDLKRLIFSKAFVFALDELRQLLDVMTKECELSEAAETMCREFLEEYEVVRGSGIRCTMSRTASEGEAPTGGALKHPFSRWRSQPIGVSGQQRSAIVWRRFRSRAKSRTRCGIDCSISIWTFPWLGPGNLRVERRG